MYGTILRMVLEFGEIIVVMVCEKSGDRQGKLYILREKEMSKGMKEKSMYWFEEAESIHGIV